MADYKYLFTPLKLGPIVLKNRIVCAAHGNQVADPVTFMVTDRAKSYYEERARGGAAAIIMVSSSVDERADYYPATNFALWTDDIIPGLKELVDICHANDCKFLVQPSHPGVHNDCHVQVDEVPRAPSQIPAVEYPNLVPKELTKTEIVEIQDKFARAAGRCVAAGVDGIELMCGHEKLTWAFLAPLSNKRTDEYGGSLENRFRFMGEMLEKVRRETGDDFPIGIRLNITELENGGMSLEEGIQIAKMFEATGKLDWLGCVMATYRSMPFELSPFCANLEPGWGGEFSRNVKAEVSMPVSVSGKITDPGLAENLIAEGTCDYVYLARTLIADPHFPRKAMQSKEDDIAPCIACNQGCVARCFAGARGTTNGIRCTVNPAAGEELRWGSWLFSNAKTRKKMVVVGAGPAGLQCALTAAQRGHEVRVYDKQDELGGQARLIKKLPGHTAPQTFLDYLSGQLQKQNVPIHLGRDITQENIHSLIDQEKPDLVALATGSRPARDGRGGLTGVPIPGWEQAHVCTYEDILLNTGSPGQNVLIVDELADRVSPGIAELLAEAGKTVTVVTRWASFSPNLHWWLDEPFTMGKLDSLGIQIHPNTWVKEISPTGATCFNIFSFREFDIPADTIVLTTMKYSQTDLYALLEKEGIECHLIGDAKAPRWIWNATHDGFKLAWEA